MLKRIRQELLTFKWEANDRKKSEGGGYKHSRVASKCYTGDEIAVKYHVSEMFLLKYARIIFFKYSFEYSNI